MSRYNDISRLLNAIGKSTRSADDPWNISRTYQGAVMDSKANSSVIGDLGAPRQELTSELQDAERIFQAQTEPMVSNGSASAATNGNTAGSGFFGNLLNNIFPLASGIAKLFGGGGSSSAPALTPYELPPSINFEGAVSGSMPGVTSLSYGADGLPRTTNSAPPVAASAPANFTAPADAIEEAMGLSTGPESETLSGGTSAGLMGQVAAMTTSTFEAGTSLTVSGMSSNLILPSAVAGSGNALMSSGSSSSAENTQTSPGFGGTTATQQTQSILVQVQAMDSQSFMDHSNDIAQAVRNAMLNLHSVNDVIADL